MKHGVKKGSAQAKSYAKQKAVRRIGMNPLWLIIVIPASAAVGATVMAFMTVASKADDEMERWDRRG